MSRGFFVAGTDTGVGKTEIARALCTLIPGVTPLKPVETGCERDKPEDALALKAASGSNLSLDEVCPYRFRMPAAPLVAAEAEGAQIDLVRIEQVVARAKGPIVVEAAGGLIVPLAREIAVDDADPATEPPPTRIVTNLDLAERLGLPVVLVGRAGLGTLNHCALSAEAVEARGLVLAAIVLNRVQPEDDPSVASNAEWVRALTGARIVGPLAYVRDARERPARLAPHLAPLVDSLKVGR